jgi:hypothetical protein
MSRVEMLRKHLRKEGEGRKKGGGQKEEGGSRTKRCEKLIMGEGVMMLSSQKMEGRERERERERKEEYRGERLETGHLVL